MLVGTRRAESSAVFDLAPAIPDTAYPHSSLDKMTPAELYFATLPAIKQAA